MSSAEANNDKRPDKDESIPTVGPADVVGERGGQIGPYKQLSVLGEGGFAVVYLAEQQEPVKRRVALKVIKAGMDTKQVIARFEAERQALALLDHPNIAQVFDAGTTDSGRPYFVMEYVKGLSITEHCDREKLSIEERLELFRQVCEGVQHAHQKGIIHRDIKPSNILVYMEGNKAIPKIIDFGVAKAISQPLTDRTLYTEADQIIGTPEYMSPEQAEMIAQDIDTRSDIYSLGAVLYELLTGTLPFDSKTLRKGGIEHIRRVIREEEPKTPSTRLTSLGAQATQIVQHRRTEVGTLARRLQSELEWIPLKAMRKERARRYRSASELADDIENYLEGAPLIAGPESTTYLIKKFVKRKRALVTGIAAVMVVLIAGIVVSTIFAIGQARARAEAQVVSDFLQNSVLGSLNIYNVRGEEITVHSILDTISRNLAEKLGDQPLVEASIRWHLANAYGLLGLYKPAESHARRALEIRQTLLDDKDMKTLHSIWQLGWLYMLQGRCYEAEPLLAKVLAGFEIAPNEGHFRRLYCMNQLGWVYNFQGRLSKAERLFENGLEAVRRVLGDEHPYEPTFLLGLGCAYYYQGHYAKAEQLLTEGLKLSRRVRGENDIETMLLMHCLGELHGFQGRYREAEEHLINALNRKLQVLGEQHPFTLNTISVLGWLYHRQGRYEKAEPLFVKSIETFHHIEGDENINNLISMLGLGSLYLSQGRYYDAEPLLNKVLEIGIPMVGEESGFILSAMNTKAKLYTAQGRYVEAEQLYNKTLEIQRRVLGNDHPYTLDSINGFALLRTKQKEYDKAESLFDEALKGRRRKLGHNHPATLETKNDLSVMYKEQARHKEAEKLLLQAVEGRRLRLGDTHPHTLESWKNLIELYEAWDKPEKANEWRAKLPQTEDIEE